MNKGRNDPLGHHSHDEDHQTAHADEKTLWAGLLYTPGDILGPSDQYCQGVHTGKYQADISQYGQEYIGWRSTCQ